MKQSKIEKKAIQNIFNKFEKAIPRWHKFIDISFLPDEMKKKYHEMIEFKQSQIKINSPATKDRPH